MMQTLDQQRAALAWKYASAGMAAFGKEYKGLAKGAPALIMNSGLMPTLAYYKAKGGAASHLLDDLIRALARRIDGRELAYGQGEKTFAACMVALQAQSGREYLRHTDEALEMLKWIRQFVDAVEGRED